ncbi:MAG: Gfo/Idh/MocA family protein [Eubacteriales bacterium]|jgi:1,5-anhydro-D-fructose reductase (1,5-anhydro-D-mannitol-forming)
MEQGNICWGMIGCGDVTEVKNGPGLYKARHSMLRGVTNRTLSRAEDWVRRHGAGRVYPSVEALLADPAIDIVYVATTPDCHKRYAVQVAQAGKHCYLEKPIALNYQEAVEIQQAFQKSGTQIYVAHYRRGMERFKAIREMLDSGEIGQIRGMQVEYQQQMTDAERLPADQQPWRVRGEHSGGGHFFEGGIHQLDLMDFLLGPIEHFSLEVENRSGFYQAEDMVSLTARTRTGALISGLWLYDAPWDRDEMRIFGTRGTVRFGYWDNESPIRVETAQGERSFAPPVPPDVGTAQIQDIVNALRGEGSCSSTLEAAMRSLRITDASIAQFRSQYSG